MPKGGARARSGPAPDPDALRRERDSGSWVTLPAAGRDGETPEWPLENPTERELVLWERQWCRPQAIMWERNCQEDEVAMFVRSLALAEDHRAPVQSRVLVRQQMEALGISMPGLQRNRWRIEAEAPQAERRQAPSTKGRLKVVA